MHWRVRLTPFCEPELLSKQAWNLVKNCLLHHFATLKLKKSRNFIIYKNKYNQTLQDRTREVASTSSKKAQVSPQPLQAPSQPFQISFLNQGQDLWLKHSIWAWIIQNKGLKHYFSKVKSSLCLPIALIFLLLAC